MLVLFPFFVFVFFSSSSIRLPPCSYYLPFPGSPRFLPEESGGGSPCLYCFHFSCSFCFRQVRFDCRRARTTFVCPGPQDSYQRTRAMGRICKTFRCPPLPPVDNFLTKYGGQRGATVSHHRFWIWTTTHLSLEKL